MKNAALVIAVAIAAGLSWPAAAQQPQTVRLQGTIEKIDGNLVTAKSRDGAVLRIVLADHAQILAVTKASVSDIKQGVFIGSGAVPQPDGTQKAMEVHIFTEALRGNSEGHRPWQGAPTGTMTNGTVGTAVTGVDGPVITVKYRDGEKKIVVAPGTPITRYDLGSKDDLKPGASIRVSRAVKKADGTFEAAGATVSRDSGAGN